MPVLSAHQVLQEWSAYASNKHFSIDGTLIDGWALHKSVIKKDGGEPPEDGTHSTMRTSRARSAAMPLINRPAIVKPGWWARATGMLAAWHIWRTRDGAP